jgi:hypothetical protein
MLSPTNLTVNTDLFKELYDITVNQSMKTVLNEPTGNFFYDPWTIKKEYVGTVWEELIKPLTNIGEARKIVLDPTQCYHAHADIDDRYHLTIQTEECYLIDLTNNCTHKLNADGIWYEMDAGRLHTAANFGRYPRIQLVVRKLMSRPVLKKPVNVKFTATVSNPEDRRFLFDNTVSTVLNSFNKLGVIDNFSFGNVVSMTIENDMVSILKQKLPLGFDLELV